LKEVTISGIFRGKLEEKISNSQKKLPPGMEELHEPNRQSYSHTQGSYQWLQSWIDNNRGAIKNGGSALGVRGQPFRPRAPAL
jgi:hypothetical protein